MPRSRRASVAASARVFAALGDDGPTSIAKLTSGAHVTRQAITKHLRVLEGAGLVRGVREGRESVWELTPAKVAEAKRCLDEISKQWDEVLGRLKALVEE